MHFTFIHCVLINCAQLYTLFCHLSLLEPIGGLTSTDFCSRSFAVLSAFPVLIVKSVSCIVCFIIFMTSLSLLNRTVEERGLRNDPNTDLNSLVLQEVITNSNNCFHNAKK